MQISISVQFPMETLAVAGSVGIVQKFRDGFIKFHDAPKFYFFDFFSFNKYLDIIVALYLDSQIFDGRAVEM